MRMAGPEGTFGEVGDEYFALVHDVGEVDATFRATEHGAHERRRQERLNFIQYRVYRRRAKIVIPRRVLLGEAVDDGVFDLLKNLGAVPVVFE
jgi:hypothetical protein